MKKWNDITNMCDQLGLEIVMGAETHITLNTETKLNCSCQNTDVDTPNIHICPVCTGQPGAMPEVNGLAVEKAILLGKAINADISQTLDMDRKHYEYPDLPSGFQRSQFWNPIIDGGIVQAIEPSGEEVRVELDHIHMEEDAGKLVHDGEAKKSYIDYNRAGRPLLEVVTTPTIHTLPTLMAYLKQLHRIVKILGISEAELAKGYFKTDISISLRKQGEDILNERTEIKNLNSFKAIENAVSKEIMNQLVYREKNDAPKTRQVTVLYNEDTDSMKIMREKENESDYRFVRESNIPSIDLIPLMDTINVDMKYLPYTIEKSLVDVGIRPQDATYFSSNLIRAQRLFEINDKVQDLNIVAKVLMNEIQDNQFADMHVAAFADILHMYTTNDTFSNILLKEIIVKVLDDPMFDFTAYIAEQTSGNDEAVDIAIDSVIEEKSDVIQEIMNGNKGKIGSLVGVVLGKLDVKVSGGSIKEKIEQKLGLESADISSKKEKRKRSKERIDVNALNIASAYLAKQYQTHEVREIDETFIGKEVTLSGRIHSIRDHGHLLFIDLRQNGEIFQIKISQDAIADIDTIARLKNETVIQLTGIIVRRDASEYNDKLRTGTIELEASGYNILNYAQELPFEIARAAKVNESARLEFRYLSLRNEHVRNNIIKRSRIVSTIRNFFDSHGFNEIETPVLTRGSDEGSREFPVPSRLHPGKFYVLPQAPQQFKQLLMNSDIHRYYQVAKCFRDEDPRGDRQPEFTQIDIELAYTSEKEVIAMVSDLLYTMVKKVYPKKQLMHPEGIPTLSYQEAMDKYGTDKPDIRFGLTFKNITDIVRNTSFNVFRDPIEAGGIVKCMKVEGKDIAATNTGSTYFGQKYKKNYLVDLVKSHGLGGLAYLEVHGDTLQPHMNVDKLGEDVCWKIIEEMGAQDGDTIFFAADKEETVNKALDVVRRELGNKLNLYPDNLLGFCWVVDFPMFEKTEEGTWKFTHNPFSMPKIEHMKDFMNGENIPHIQAQQYDIALNGHEIGGGSVRAHLPHVLHQTYKIMGYNEQELQSSIGHILDAFSYGCPPHGGLALGLDRIMMILQRQPSIRDVIAFPKTGDAKDLLMRAPSTLSQETLDDVFITITDAEGY